MFKIHCPHCQHKLSADATKSGATLQCPACGVDFVIPSPTDEVVIQPQSPEDSAEATASREIQPEQSSQPESSPEPGASHSFAERLRDGYKAAQEGAKFVKKGALVGWAGLKRRSKQAALKVQIVKLRNIDLRKPYHALGKSAFEQGILADELTERFQAIKDLDAKIAGHREKTSADADETKMAALIRVSKDTAKSGQAQALTVKREHLITVLGREIHACKEQMSTGDLSDEFSAIDDIENRIRDKEDEVRGLNDGGKSGIQTLAVAAVIGLLVIGAFYGMKMLGGGQVREKGADSNETAVDARKSQSSSGKTNSEEIFQRGLRFFNGEKFPGQAALNRDIESKDLDHALKLFLQAAETGHAEAQYYAAVCYGAGVAPKMQEAKRWMQKSANQGLTKAQYLLGVGYISGDFGEKDETNGLSWISKAAESHNADAQWFLGLRHLRGEGVSLDEKRAAALFQEAAKQDHAQACYELGVCYEKGIGVENDPNKAANWLASASLLTMNLPKIPGIAEKHPLRVSDPEKQVEYGIAYVLGKDQVHSKKNAFYLFQKSAQRGSRKGQYCLGLAYSQGDGVDKDEKLGFEWFKKSADQNWPPAEFHLGECYYWGHGVSEDKNKALLLFQKALPGLEKSMKDLCENRIKVLRGN